MNSWDILILEYFFSETLFSSSAPAMAFSFPLTNYIWCSLLYPFFLDGHSYLTLMGAWVFLDCSFCFLNTSLHPPLIPEGRTKLCRVFGLYLLSSLSPPSLPVFISKQPVGLACKILSDLAFLSALADI